MTWLFERRMLSVLVFILLATCPAAGAASPAAIYSSARQQVVAVEVLDDDGEMVAALSAVVVAPEQLVTLCSLVDGAGGLRLVYGDHRAQAVVTGRDPGRDLCQLGAAELPDVTPAVVAAEDPAVGASVYAVGNTLGLGVGISEGVVSAVWSQPAAGEAAIQFTAPIGPGSGGGGLYDAAGRLVGIVQFRNLDGQNINFACPARWIHELSSRAAATATQPAWRGTAMRLAAASDWTALAEHGRAWTAALPDHAEAWYWLGTAANAMEEWPAAEKAFRMALAENPAAVAAGHGLAVALVRQSRPEEALEVTRGLLAFRREDAAVWLDIGLIEMALAHPTQAKQALAQAAQLAPWDPRPQGGLVDIARGEGNWIGVVAALNRVTHIDPGAVQVWIELAEALCKLHRYTRGLAAADRALALAPGQPDALLLKGMALAALGRMREAIDTLRAGLDGQPANPAWGWNSLGRIYSFLGLWPEAIEAFREAVRLDPANLAWTGELGVALKDGGLRQEALFLFERLADQKPEDPFPWRQLGYTNALLFRPEAAIPALERSLALDPRDPKVWNALLEMYHAAGRTDDVRRGFQRLFVLDRAWADDAYRRLLLPYEARP
ncbi:MAG: tetratricopeptide repeat protein [Thermodesulfobacteriota bacterium]